MSNIIASITQIHHVKSLHIVEFDFNGTLLKMMSLDLSENISVGKRVVLGIKPTQLAIAKNFSGEVSYSNQINAIITEIEQGELLSSITLKVHDISLESIITTNSSQRMHLKINDEVTLLVKASEISILELLDV